VVVGARALNRQAFHHLGNELQLAAVDSIVRAVGDEGQVAETLLRIEELDNGVLPIFLVDGAVDLDAMVPELGLEAEFVVDQVSGRYWVGVSYW
jgi:hypothetical protein